MYISHISQVEEGEEERAVEAGDEEEEEEDEEEVLKSSKDADTTMLFTRNSETGKTKTLRD